MTSHLWHGHGSPWTAEREDRLIELWADDALSCSTIGAMLGFSKNAVVGKAHRLDLPARPSPIQRREIKAKPLTQARRERAARQALELKCCWPVETPGKYFCDAPVTGWRTPYCTEHTQLAYTKPRATTLERV